MTRALALALLLLGPSASAAVLVVRHAEKLDPKADASLLSRKGKKRAKELARVLAAVPLKAVYCTEYERTRQTAQPAADAKGLKVTVTDSDHTDALASEVGARGAEADILVVGHSDTIPDLLRGLGVAEPVVIPSDEYDNLFVVTPRKDGPAAFLRLKY